MIGIKFERDYGYAPGAPFWITWDGTEEPKRFETRDEAEASAASEVAELPGYKPVHVLCCMATVTTDVQVIGTRFDPNRAPPRAVEPLIDVVDLPAPDFPADLLDMEPI